MFRRALLLADISASAVAGHKHDHIDAIVYGLTNAIHRISPFEEKYSASIVIPIAELMQWSIDKETILNSVRAHALAEQLADNRWEFDISIDHYRMNLIIISLKIQKTWKTTKTDDVKLINVAPVLEPSVETGMKDLSLVGERCLCGEEIMHI